MFKSQNKKSAIFRDLCGVLILLTLGVGGQIFLFMPVEILTPNLPILSRELIPNSASTQISERSPTKLISTQRQFEVTIIIGEEDKIIRGDGWLTNNGAKISQKVYWYANPIEANVAWEQSTDNEINKFYDIPPVISKSLDDKNPAYILYCSDEPNKRKICVYFSYWKHWYTVIWFWSGGEEFLSLNEIQQLSLKATNLLILAPDKPQSIFQK